MTMDALNSCSSHLTGNSQKGHLSSKIMDKQEQQVMQISLCCAIKQIAASYWQVQHAHYSVRISYTDTPQIPNM
jgi:hypothetical protein